jgi:bacterioferritin (cytochrome b1)
MDLFSINNYHCSMLMNLCTDRKRVLFVQGHPTLVQIHMFWHGEAIKGTFQVNQKVILLLVLALADQIAALYDYFIL